MKPSKKTLNTVILILAAGGSARMGKRVKQLLAWRNTNLLQHSITQAANSSANAVYVVLGAHASQIQAALTTEVDIIFNQAWKSGIGSSIAKGVAHIQEKERQETNVLIMLADQPFITSAQINLIIENFNTTDYTIVASKYGKGIGVPAIFSHTHTAQLLQLENDEGAKKIIATHKSSCLAVEIASALDDIDTPEDYERLKGKQK